MTFKAIDRLATREQGNNLTGQWMNTAHFKYSVKRDFEIRDNRTGKLVLMLVKRAIPESIWQPAHDFLKTVNKVPQNRGTAVGGKGAMMPGITMAGRLSLRRRIDDEVLAAAGNPRSDFLGYYDRGEGGEKWCRETEWTTSHPEVFGPEVKNLMRAVSETFALCLPEEHAIQAAEVAKIPPHLVVEGTAYTTLTDNKNLRTASHRDTGDLAVGVSALTSTTGGVTDGLIFAEYGLAADFQPGDVLFCDAHLLHGNAPFTGERLTQVYYVREQLHLCSTK
jgi:hypothetical protein